jgi:uncharacterized repeat protein (TIGR03803 family)
MATTAPEIVQNTVYSFSGAQAGGHPNGLLRGMDGKLYGTTQSGGSNGSGAVFRLDTNGPPAELYSFSGGADGARPSGELLQRGDGNFFGTTYAGGTNAFGTLFRFSTNGTLTTLFDLDRTNGVLPTAGLAQG